MKKVILLSSFASLLSLGYVHGLMIDCNNNNMKLGIEKEECIFMDYIKKKLIKNTANY